MPFLPPGEALHQIELNAETCRRFLGTAYQPQGIFLPEMAWDPKLAPLLEGAGFKYVLLELANDGRMGAVDYQHRFVVEGTRLTAWFRQRRLSNAIMHRALQSVADVKRAAAEDVGHGRYLVTGMDGEVFGNWYPGYEEFLFAMHEDKNLGMGRVADLMAADLPERAVPTVACSWADSERDLAAGAAFFSWRDPDNQLQAWEWELQQLALTEFARVPEEDPAWHGLRAKLTRRWPRTCFFGRRRGRGGQTYGSRTGTAGTGETRLVTLEDGSRVQLDARSAIAVRYGAAERRVASSRARPGSRSRRTPRAPSSSRRRAARSAALGTAFDVALENPGRAFAVAEHSVRVTSGGTACSSPKASAPPSRRRARPRRPSPKKRLGHRLAARRADRRGRAARRCRRRARPPSSRLCRLRDRGDLRARPSPASSARTDPLQSLEELETALGLRLAFFSRFVAVFHE